jgi:HEAT repeat protein
MDEDQPKELRAKIIQELVALKSPAAIGALIRALGIENPVRPMGRSCGGDGRRNTCEEQRLERQKKEENRCPPCSRMIVDALVAFGPVAVPQLISQLTTQDHVDEYAGALMSALVGIGPAAVPGLFVALKDGSELVRGRAARTLGAMPVQSRAIETALRLALKDGSPWVRASAAYALGDARAKDPETKTALKVALSDPDGDVRNAATHALCVLKSSSSESATSSCRP